MSEKRIIKASEVEAAGVNVEKVDYEIRKFGDKVYKHVPLDEQPLAMEDQSDLPDPDFSAESLAESDSAENQVQLERFYGDEGELTGLKITCRCGEVIDLEFTREQDELPAADSPVEATPPVATEQPPPMEPETATE